MTKKRSRVRSENSVNLVGRDMVMTEGGLVPVEKAATGGGGAVHAPQLMNLGNQLMTPRRGTRELLRLYGESPWLRAIVGKISRSVADTDWVLFAKRKVRGGKYVMPDGVYAKSGSIRQKRLDDDIADGLIDPINNHPLLELIHNGTGNPRLNGFASMQVTQSHLELTGEAFWLLEPNEFGVPFAYWPIPPSWVMNFPTASNPFYEFSIPGGTQVKIPVSMVVPFIDPDPDNPYARGVGIAKSLDDEIQIDEFAAKHQKAFFLNRARPDIIVSGQFINQKDAERLEKQWLADHQGFWKSFKPLFFSQKVEVKELTQSFESMQMVQVRKHERDTFVSVFGAPPEKFGIIGESKRSTIAAADFFWNKDLIKPRVEMIRRILQQVLVPMFDERLILYYETPVVQDEELKLQAMKTAPYASTLNEWRKVQGQETLGPAGDVLVVPLNSQIIPVKGSEGQAITGQDMVQESIRQRMAAGPMAQEQIETRAMAAEIAEELIGAVEQSFRELTTRRGE
jgi:hypothetical protein